MSRDLSLLVPIQLTEPAKKPGSNLLFELRAGEITESLSCDREYFVLYTIGELCSESCLLLVKGLAPVSSQGLDLVSDFLHEALPGCHRFLFDAVEQVLLLFGEFLLSNAEALLLLFRLGLLRCSIAQLVGNLFFPRIHRLKNGLV